MATNIYTVWDQKLYVWGYAKSYIENSAKNLFGKLICLFYRWNEHHNQQVTIIYGLSSDKIIQLLFWKDNDCFSVPSSNLPETLLPTLTSVVQPHRNDVPPRHFTCVDTLLTLTRNWCEFPGPESHHSRRAPPVPLPAQDTIVAVHSLLLSGSILVKPVGASSAAGWLVRETEEGIFIVRTNISDDDTPTAVARNVSSLQLQCQPACGENSQQLNRRSWESVTGS